MKNLNFKFILIVVLFIHFVPNTSAYLFFDPFPSIETDKNEYFVDENIQINASWNIYSSPDEETHIKVLIMSVYPGNSTPGWALNNSLFEIECPCECGYPNYITNINISDLYDNCTQFPLMLWPVLIIYNLEDGILVNDDVFWKWTQISINKYNPMLFSEIPDPIAFEFNDDYILNNYIIAQQNTSKCYPERSFTVDLYQNSTILGSLQSNVSINGEFSINLAFFNINWTGIYIISLNVQETELFYEKNFLQNINVTDKEVNILTTNSSKFCYDSSLEYFWLEIQMIDNENNSFILDNIVFTLLSDLNYSGYVLKNQSYNLKFLYPQNSGFYCVNISIEKEGYKFHPSYNNIQFKEYPEADFTVSSQLIIIGQNLQFLFIGTEGNKPTNFLWDFGDGIGTSEEQNPIYTYNSTGIYEVTLSIIDDEGDESKMTKENYIEILNDIIPEANFMMETSNFIVNKNIQFLFIGIRGNEPSCFFWDFGDGIGTSEEQNPIYMYNSIGNYQVNLTITDLDGDFSMINCQIYVSYNESGINLPEITDPSENKIYKTLSVVFFLSTGSIFVVFNIVKKKKKSNNGIPLASIKI